MDILGVEVSIVGILVAAVASFVVGAVWYSPLLFGKQWQKLVGMTEKQVQGQMTQIMVGGFLVGLALAFFIAVVTQLIALPMALALNNDSVLVINIVTALVLWTGFMLVPSINDMLYTKKDVKLVGIDMGYQLINFVVIAVALAFV